MATTAHERIDVPTTLILGATSGIAQAVCRQLALRGERLFLVARDAHRLQAAAADLGLRGADIAGILAADLDRIDGHTDLLDEAWRALGTVDLVLVAHGVLGDQGACEADPARAQAVLDTNLGRTAVLLLHLTNRLQAQGSGTLAVISSVAGERGRASNYVYGAGKAGLTALLSGLRARLAPAGVRVVTVKPGPVATAMLADRPHPPLTADPDTVARGLLRGLARGCHTIWLPGIWRWIMLVIRLLPERMFMKLKF